ncbi:MAG TPA: polysaccharide biosynthesis C-terminal domain-containing protein [Thermoplasmata archaeon]|nr:polysaccharide biosynthesis C-terminal domain-containing protein [Thermoplasmata archaeon]
MGAPPANELHDGLTTVTRGTILVIVSTLCLVLFNFLSRVLLVDNPASDWNSFSYVLALTGMVSAVGTLGLPNAVARGLPYAPTDAERRTIVRSSLAITVGAAAVIAVGLWAAGPFFARSLHVAHLAIGLEFFGVATAASIVAGLLAAVFQGYADVVPNALFVQVLNPGLFLAFLGVAILWPSVGLTYSTALLAYVLASVVTLAALVGYALRQLPRRLPSGPGAPGAEGRLLRFAAPLFVAGAFLSVSGYGDTFILGLYAPLAVGNYTASLILARLIAIGINAAAFIFLPVATGFLRRENPRAIQLTYATVTKWLILLSMPLFLLFVFLPARSLQFVYAGHYPPVVLPLQITVAGAFGATVLGPGATAQIAFGRVRLLAINSAAAGIADVTIALALVPSHGAVGAAIAWSSSTLLYAALCLIELALLDRVHPFGRDFLLPLGLTAVPCAAVLLLLRDRVPEWTLPPIGLAAAGLFVVWVIATRSVDEGERLLLGAVERILGRKVPFVRRLGRWSRAR